MIVQYLMKQAIVIVQSDSLARQSERCNGIQEARCQSAKSAVSKRRLRLRLLNLRKISSVLCQNLIHSVIDLQIDQIVGKKLSDQEFCGNIIDLLLAGVSLGDGQKTLAIIKNGVIKLFVRAGGKGFAVFIRGEIRKLLLHVQCKNVSLHVGGPCFHELFSFPYLYR